MTKNDSKDFDLKTTPDYVKHALAKCYYDSYMNHIKEYTDYWNGVIAGMRGTMIVLGVLKSGESLSNLKRYIDNYESNKIKNINDNGWNQI